MRPISPRLGLGARTSTFGASLTARRREAAAVVLSGQPWLMWADRADVVASPGTPLDVWNFRKGGNSTASGATRPVLSRDAVEFGGSQRMQAASGIADALWKMCWLAVVRPDTTNLATVVVFGHPWNTASGAIMQAGDYSGTRYLWAGTAQAGAFNARAGRAVVAGTRGCWGATADRTLAGADETSIYYDGAPVTPVVASTTDMTAATGAALGTWVGARGDGTNPWIGGISSVAVLASAPGASEVSRLQWLLLQRAGLRP